MFSLFAARLKELALARDQHRRRDAARDDDRDADPADQRDLIAKEEMPISDATTTAANCRLATTSVCPYA